MTEPGLPKQETDLKDTIRQRAEAHLGAIRNLVTEIGGENADIDSVLPKTMTAQDSARQDDPTPDWSEDQITKAHALAIELGYGPELDINSQLVGGARIVEGGLAWKIAAEVQALGGENNPSLIVFSASARRPLKEEELKFVSEQLQMPTEGLHTEYDFAKAFASTHTQNPEETDLPHGYQVAEGNSTVNEPTGQLKMLGSTESGQQLWLLRVDREDYEEEGKPKYRHQPSSEVVMRFVSDVLMARGDSESPVGLITSHSYASRVPQAWRAGLKHGREFGVTLYGRATLAEVQQQPMKAGVDLNQLPGELRVMHDNLQRLLGEIE